MTTATQLQKGLDEQCRYVNLLAELTVENAHKITVDHRGKVS